MAANNLSFSHGLFGECQSSFHGGLNSFMSSSVQKWRYCLDPRKAHEVTTLLPFSVFYLDWNDGMDTVCVTGPSAGTYLFAVSTKPLITDCFSPSSDDSSLGVALYLLFMCNTVGCVHALTSKFNFLLTELVHVPDDFIISYTAPCCVHPDKRDGAW